MEKADSEDGMTASEHIDEFIRELKDWRGKWIAYSWP